MYHPYIILESEGYLLGQPLEVTKKKKQTGVDHVVDVLPIHLCTVAIERKTISRREFQESILEMVILQVILVEARHAL